MGLLSTRTPQAVGVVGGGIPNPSLGVGVTRSAMPKGAIVSWKPASSSADCVDILTPITVGAEPRALAIDSSDTVYVANAGSGTVTKIAVC